MPTEVEGMMLLGGVGGPPPAGVEDVGSGLVTVGATAVAGVAVGSALILLGGKKAPPKIRKYYPPRLQNLLRKQIERYWSSKMRNRAAASSPALALVMHDTAIVVDVLAFTIGDLAEAVYGGFSHLTHTTVPTKINRAVAPVAKIAQAALTEAKRATLRLTKAKIAIERGLRPIWGVRPGTFDELIAQWVTLFVREWNHVYRTITPEIQKIKENTIPKIQRDIKTLQERIKAAETIINTVVITAISRINTTLSTHTKQIATLLPLLTPAGMEAAFRPVIPRVCTEIGECAANNLLGKRNWSIFKDLLALLLGVGLDALILSELCTIATAVRTIVEDAKPAIRAVAVVQGGLASLGCASKTPPLPAPLYH